MYLAILKKDLRRKRAMNFIFAAFVMLATAFIGSSTRSLIATTGGLEGYFDKAGVGDYMISVGSGEVDELEEFLEDSDSIRSYSQSGSNLLTSKDYVTLSSGEEINYSFTICVTVPETYGQKYFDADKQEIVQVEQGECYLPYSLMEGAGLQEGDRITVTIGDTSRAFTVAGEMMDAVMGGEFISMKRILMSTEDYDILRDAALDAGMEEYIFYMIDMGDEQTFVNEFYASGIVTLTSFNRDTLGMTYVMDMIIAVIFVVVSIVLIIIALVVLRFTVSFTMEQEYREIGILKALGIRNGSIRLLYLSKHIVLTLAGSAAGMGVGLLLENVMMAGASRRIMLEESDSILLQIFPVLAVLAVVLLFGCICTGRVNRISPVTAMRAGAEGESFSRSSPITLGGTGAMPLPFFMALNDILSEVKKFTMMILIFTLGILMINIPLSAVSTLRSDEMILLMNMAKCDGAMIREDPALISQTKKELEQELDDIEAKLMDGGIGARAFREVLFRYTLSFEDNMASSIAVQGLHTDTAEYLYFSGAAPELANEIAVTSLVAEKLGAHIGDTVNIMIDGENREFMITALYESLTNMGEGVRFSENAVLDYTEKSGAMGIQFALEEDTDAGETEQKLAEIRELFPEYEVMSCEEFADDTIGVSGILDSVSRVILAIVLAVNALIAVLMVRSFISRERSDIALLKSMGFPDGTLILWQGLRISLVLIISTILGSVLTLPLSDWILSPVFGIMGTSRITIVIDPMMSYCVYPLTVLAVTTVFALFSALQITKIKAREINNI